MAKAAVNGAGTVCHNTIIHKGPFKYYVIKRLGGWSKANDYDRLLGRVTGFGSMIT